MFQLPELPPCPYHAAEPPEELAAHKCYDYQPKRFHELMDETREETFSQVPEIVPKIIETPEGEE
jgi:hypothetical protein